MSKKSSFQNITQADPSHPWPDYYLAEAKVGPSGALFFYSRPTINTSVEEVPQRESSLINIINGRVTKLVKNLNLGNGVGYSANGEWFYMDDMFSNLTYVAHFDQRTNSMSKL